MECVPPRLSLLNTFRAVLGVGQSVLFLGDFGTAIKALLTGDFREIPVFPLALFMLWSATILSTLYLARKQLPFSVPFLLFVAIFIPVFAFGAIWQGSDVERFCFTVPVLILFLCSAISSLSPVFRNVVLSLLLFFGSANLVQIAFFSDATRESLIAELIAVTNDYLPKRSLLVVSGQDLGPRVWSPVQYHTNDTMFSFLFDSQTHGENGWEQRLQEEIEKTLSHGGKVAVIDSLLTDKAISPPPVLTEADPHPPLPRVREFFQSYVPVRTWNVKEYAFVELKLPKKANEKS